MRFQGLARWAGGLFLAIGLMSGGVAIAQTGAPAPTAPATLLRDQTDHVAAGVADSSSNSHFPSFASQAADDFVVPNNAIWRVTNVTVPGEYKGVSGSGILSLLVQIYTNSGNNLPGALLINQTVASNNISGLITGNLAVTLSPEAVLGPGRYWLSVQARENCAASNCKTWVWTQRTLQSNGASAWQNPSGGIAPACKTWQVLVSHCSPPEDNIGPDLLFRLDGTSTPIAAQIFLPVTYR